jgi:hypothetical protein
VQWERPCASVAATPSVAVPANSVAVPANSVAVAAPSVKYYVKVGDGDFPYNVASKALEDAMNSVCPEDKSSTCHTEMVRADPKEQTAIEGYNGRLNNQTKTKGGARNKKKHRRTNRRTNRRTASRRTASRRTAPRRKASRRKAYRRTASRRTGKK